MRAQEIEKQLRVRPFAPFRLRITDGKAYEIRHPGMMLVSRTVLAVADARPSARTAVGIILCDPVHVIRIEPINGRRSSNKR